MISISCRHKTTFRYETFRTNRGWGYNILSKERILIHQENIPAKDEVSGFASETVAAATAKLVIEKLQQGRMPSVTKEEMKKIEAETGNE